MSRWKMHCFRRPAVIHPHTRMFIHGPCTVYMPQRRKCIIADPICLHFASDSNTLGSSRSSFLFTYIYIRSYRTSIPYVHPFCIYIPCIYKSQRVQFWSSVTHIQIFWLSHTSAEIQTARMNGRIMAWIRWLLDGVLYYLISSIR